VTAASVTAVLGVEKKPAACNVAKPTGATSKAPKGASIIATVSVPTAAAAYEPA